MFGIKKKKIFPVISNEQERKKEYKRLTQELEMEEKIKERRKSTYKKRGRPKQQLDLEVRKELESVFLYEKNRWGEPSGIHSYELFKRLEEKNLLKSIRDCKSQYEKRDKGHKEISAICRKWRDQTRLPLVCLRQKRFLCTEKELPELDKKIRNVIQGYMNTWMLVSRNAKTTTTGGNFTPNGVVELALNGESSAEDSPKVFPSEKPIV